MIPFHSIQMDRMIHNLATLKPRATDDATRVGFLIILQSRRFPTSYWVYSFSPYKLNPLSIQAAFWWDTASDEACPIRTDQRSFERKYKSGLWVPILISRLSLESMVVPYEYCVAFHPEDIMDYILESDDRSEIVGLNLYHRDSNKRSIATCQSPPILSAKATFYTWIHHLPWMLHARRMKHITQQIECHPPNHTGSFPGGILYQIGEARFNFA